MPDHTELIERLRTEADQCRNDGADDIARLLDAGADALQRQAREIEALRADAGRLDFLDQLSNRAATSDMHCSYGSVVLYVRTGIGSQLLAQGNGTARAAIDSARQGVEG